MDYEFIFLTAGLTFLTLVNPISTGHMHIIYRLFFELLSGNAHLLDR